MTMWYKGNKQNAKTETTRWSSGGLFRKTTFSLTLKTNDGANHLNSQKKNAFDRGNNGPCIGPKVENLR